MTRDQLAARLLVTFTGELEEQVHALNAELLGLEGQPTSAERLKAMFRIAHTLKGAARAAGVSLVAQACHALETLLADARDGRRTLGPGDFAVLYSTADALADAGQRLKAGEELSRSALAEVRDALAGRQAHARGRATEPEPRQVSAPPRERADGQVRVDAEKLDALLAAQGQLLVAAGRVAGRGKELGDFHEAAIHWAEGWRRARRRLRVALERLSPPHFVSRTLDGVDEHLDQLAREVGRLAAAAGRDLEALERATDEVAYQVRRLRMRPFGDICEALPRAVRDLATAAGKEVRLEIRGEEVEADRVVLDGLREAVLHLVRNAVDHGVEPPEVRVRAGKRREGTVRVVAALRGDRVVVTVTDDGAGLDAAAIRTGLAQRGLSVPDEDPELARLLLESGLSTRLEPTEISGRGVGLDIVRTAIRRVRGTVGLAWTPGAGTTCTLECPPTLASLRALLVAVGPQILAFPTADVARLLRLKPEEIRRVEGRDVLVAPEGPVPVVALARLLPGLPERPLSGAVRVVVLTAEGRRLAVAVDEFVGEQEVVLRPIGRRERSVPAVSGGALLATGRVALVLHSPTVVAAGVAAGTSSALTWAERVPEGPSRRRILVVDDSITTRTLQESILEAAGYDVLTAVDGAEAWKTLQEQRCDLVVADIEMPRMDGFALCEAVRGSKRMKELPVVLVTALETPEHRARGLEVGADAFIGKSSFDQRHLLETIEQLLGP